MIYIITYILLFVNLSAWILDSAWVMQSVVNEDDSQRTKDTSLFGYSRISLLSLNQGKSKLETDVWKTLFDLNLNRPKVTKRGIRGGRNKRIHSTVTADHRCSLIVAVWYVQSCRNKSLDIADYIISDHLDILFLTETLLKDKGDEAVIGELTPPGYKLLHVPRHNRTGGGVATIYKSQLSVKLVSNVTKCESFEMLNLSVSSPNVSVRYVCIYRPLPSKKNKLTIPKFRDEFGQLLESLKQKYLIILGDFNVHFD